MNAGANIHHPNKVMIIIMKSTKVQTLGVELVLLLE